MSVFNIDQPEKQTIIVLLDDNHPIKYTSEAEYAIYHFNNIKLFQSVIEELINKDKQPIIIIRFSDYGTLLTILKILNSFNGHHSNNPRGHDIKRSKIRDEFTESYKFYNHQLPTIGCCDYPLSMRIIINCHHDGTTNVSDLDIIKLHQFLRFVALLHGGSFIISNSPIGQMLKENEVLNPILDDNHHLSIPRGWDNWDRIKILAKTIYDNKQLLMDDTDFKQLLGNYENFLNQPIEDPVDINDNSLDKDEGDEGNSSLYKYLNIKSSPNLPVSYNPMKLQDMLH